MIKNLFAILLFLSYLNALEVGDKIPLLKLVDQFDKTCKIDENTKTIIFANSKDKSDVLKKFLFSKEDDFLIKRNVIYLADLSGMPSIIRSLFALPKMRKYKFSICLLDIKYKKDFATKDEKITVYNLKNKVIEGKYYFTNIQELNQFFK